MSLPTKLESVANAATILVALLLSAVLVKMYLLPQPAPHTNSRVPPVQEVKAGDSLTGKLTDVDWRKNGRTLVLAVSTQCHFCTASAPFFRKLSAQAGKGVKIVAVLPQPVGAAQKYLEGEGVRVDRIQQLALSQIGVRGTPTMLLVDNSRVVQKVWVGELQPNQQEQVLGVLADAPGGFLQGAARTISP